MFNVVDTYFAGLVSTEALAALSLSFPVFFIIISMASGISTGATALISNALGSKNNELAERYASQAISFSLITSIFVTLGGLYLSPYIFRLLGAEGQYLETTLLYMDVVFLGSFSFILVNVFNAIISSKGNTKPFRNFLVVSFLLNLILDPWFLFGGYGLEPMGIRGVGLATVVIEILGCIYMGSWAIKTGLVNKRCFRRLIPEKKVFLELSHQSFPACFSMLTISLGIFVYTFFVSAFGQAAIAAYGIAIRIEQIALLPSIGLNMATLAIVGQNSGAKRFDRVFETWKTAVSFGLLILFPGILLVHFFKHQLMSLFTNDPIVISYGVEYLQISVFIFWAYSILFVSVNALQGLKKPTFALLIGITRQVILPIPLILLLLHVFETGITGIWWSIFIVSWTAALITLAYLLRTMKKLRCY